MVQNVQQGPDEAKRIGQADAQSNIGHLGHGTVGEHTFKILLGNGHHRAKNNACRRHPTNYRGNRQDINEILGLEYGEHHAYDNVGGDLNLYCR